MLPSRICFASSAWVNRSISSLFELNSMGNFYPASELLSLLGYFAVLFAKFSYLDCTFVAICIWSKMAQVWEDKELVYREGCLESGQGRVQGRVGAC